jgi:hypothetical protein
VIENVNAGCSHCEARGYWSLIMSYHKTLTRIHTMNGYLEQDSMKVVLAMEALLSALVLLSHDDLGS